MNHSPIAETYFVSVLGEVILVSISYRAAPIRDYIWVDCSHQLGVIDYAGIPYLEPKHNTRQQIGSVICCFVGGGM